ncbi:hypothetical protein QYM36_011245 [Artemia franciscana]|uniref:Uncharacterized protein n=1 Tax=Artemia franciscana TaxID=6661 RepID=A0AA88HWZ6_ARTSF|nr:hypothetical protein QYM36_011245 [Artemia franciscana]
MKETRKRFNIRQDERNEKTFIFRQDERNEKTFIIRQDKRNEETKTALAALEMDIRIQYFTSAAINRITINVHFDCLKIILPIPSEEMEPALYA